MYYALMWLGMILTPCAIAIMAGLAYWFVTGIYDMSRWMHVHEMRWHLALFFLLAIGGTCFTLKAVYDGVLAYIKFAKDFIRLHRTLKG